MIPGTRAGGKTGREAGSGRGILMARPFVDEAPWDTGPDRIEPEHVHPRRRTGLAAFLLAAMAIQIPRVALPASASVGPDVKNVAAAAPTREEAAAATSTCLPDDGRAATAVREAAAAVNSLFEIEPYVQGADDSSASVLWLPKDRDEIGYVEYGTTPAYGLSATAEKKRRLRRDGTMRRGGAWVARARLAGLAPNTKYYYRVVLGSGASGEGTFRTAPSGDGTGFTFLVFGDTTDNRKEHYRIVSVAGAMFDPAFVIHVGDAISEKADKVKDFRPVFLQPVVRNIKDAFGDGDFSAGTSWKSEFFPGARPLLMEAPYFLARGNHERNSKRMALYFEAPDGSPQGRCYGFDWGAAHFATVDTNRNFKPGSAQHAFLDGDLSASAKPFKVFFAHHPPYSSARHGSTFRIRKYIQPLLEAHGVKLAFAGHDHSYQRTVVNGVTYIVLPPGGDETYPQANRKENPDGLLFVRERGFVQVDVLADRMVVTAWTFDEGAPLPDITDRFEIFP